MIIFSVLPTFLKVTVVGQVNGGGTVFSLILVYFIGGYIRKYKDDFSKKYMKYYFLVIILSVIGLIILQIILNIAYSYGKFDINNYGIFMRTNSPFEILISTGMFLIFKNLNIGSIKSLNKVAKSMFAVYIIHTNPIVMSILWEKIFVIKNYYGKTSIFIYIIFYSSVIFVICILIDQIRNTIYIYTKKLLRID